MEIVILTAKWKNCKWKIPQKFVYKKVYEKFYVHEIASVNLSKTYFLKNANKTCKPNNRDLNRDWIREIIPHFTIKKGLWEKLEKYFISLQILLMNLSSSCLYICVCVLIFCVTIYAFMSILFVWFMLVYIFLCCGVVLPINDINTSFVYLFSF